MSYTISLTVSFSTPSQSFTAPVESFSFGVDVPVTIGGSGSGKPTFSPLTINKMLDANSPSLYKAAAVGTHIPTVTLALTRAGSNSPDATYTLTDVLIPEVSDSGSAHGGPFPMEQVTFVFARIQIISGGNEFGFDIARNITF